MKKDRLKQIKEKAGAKLAGVKEEIALRADMLGDSQSASIRAKWMNRWAELSGLERGPDGKYDYEKIDYENKWVKLEWHMCDVRIFFKLTDPKYRDRGLELLPEDCRRTFYETGPGNSKPYSEVYTDKGAFVRGIKDARKARKEGKA